MTLDMILSKHVRIRTFFRKIHLLYFGIWFLFMTVSSSRLKSKTIIEVIELSVGVMNYLFVLLPITLR